MIRTFPILKTILIAEEYVYFVDESYVCLFIEPIELNQLRKPIASSSGVI